MDLLTTVLSAVVLTAIAVFLITITVACAVIFAAAMWDIIHGRLPLSLPHERDELAERRARRDHPTRRKGKG